MSAVEFKPVKSKRLFTGKRHYDKIDWNDWAAVIDAFRDQMGGWYLEPVRALRVNGHFSFAVMSLCCTLVDALSQYFYGVPNGTEKEFKNYLNTHFPGFNATLTTPIIYMHRNKQKAASTFSDALYTGFRCGLVHEAHSKLFTGIWGSGPLVVEESKGYTTYANGGDCPTVIVNPGLFHDHLEKVFCQYLSDLSASPPASQPLRDNFKRKFLQSYGIDIGNEPVPCACPILSPKVNSQP